MKNLPTKDKPNNFIYTLYRISPLDLKEDNLSTKDKTAGRESGLINKEVPQ